MARQAKIRKRNIDPDPIYGSRLVTKFVNRLMRDGKKTVAQKVVYSVLAIILEKTGKDPLETLNQAIAAVSPKMEVKPRRVGGASYQVPMEVRGDRREALAIRWIIVAAQKRSPKDFLSQDKKNPIMSYKLAQEMLDAIKGVGEAIKKRDNTHRMAEANRAFAHFRW
ncbi:30S ribosomal protein S7 [Candidatus Gottesmanbacteria bacterium]|nr:30S ribosomal protein S7 [Candidatus Gottesmanbacteria bacterium]